MHNLMYTILNLEVSSYLFSIYTCTNENRLRKDITSKVFRISCILLLNHLALFARAIKVVHSKIHNQEKGLLYTVILY